jgi:hypothetical protein
MSAHPLLLHRAPFPLIVLTTSFIFWEIQQTLHVRMEGWGGGGKASLPLQEGLLGKGISELPFFVVDNQLNHVIRNLLARPHEDEGSCMNTSFLFPPLLPNIHTNIRSIPENTIASVADVGQPATAIHSYHFTPRPLKSRSAVSFSVLQSSL